ncbi:MAG: hypothetical protein GY940_10035 [bacterium]|nr:hypothetical protein [bacterium]
MMKNPGQPQTLRFNMQGYLMELDVTNHRWTWNKWDYLQVQGEKKQVVRHKGGLEFMKIFPTLVDKKDTGDTVPEFRNKREMDSSLEKIGVEYIFLYQGESIIEKDFQTVEEAETFYRLVSCPAWNLTNYWFAYDGNLRSWCMYDACTGQMQFDASAVEKRLQKTKQAASRLHRESPTTSFTQNNSNVYH